MKYYSIESCVCFYIFNSRIISNLCFEGRCPLFWANNVHLVFFALAPNKNNCKSCLFRRMFFSRPTIFVYYFLEICNQTSANSRLAVALCQPISALTTSPEQHHFSSLLRIAQPGEQAPTARTTSVSTKAPHATLTSAAASAASAAPCALNLASALSPAATAVSRLVHTHPCVSANSPVPPHIEHFAPLCASTRKLELE